MKLILMAAALSIGGAAVAQTTGETTDTEAATTAQPDTGTTTTTTTTAPMATGGQTVAPGNTAPERDARGIAVVSAPATAPSGYNQPAQMVPAGTPMPAAGPAPTMGAAGPLPPCSRTVTDHCTQTYERGRSH
jgi:hypothetical protein